MTCDAMFGGAVRFWQPARGYRVNIDALLLAGFAAQHRPDRALDLGSGVGAVTLALHHLQNLTRATLVEREPELARLARRNLALSELDAEVIVADLECDALPKQLVGSADLVVSNPPFFEPGASRPAKEAAAQSARFGWLAPFLCAAGRALSGKRARACIAYPARSLERLLECAREQALVPKRLRFVHSEQGRPARLCLIELRRAKPGGLVVEAPLYEWVKGGIRSPEVALLLSPEAAFTACQTADRS